MEREHFVDIGQDQKEINRKISTLKTQIGIVKKLLANLFENPSKDISEIQRIKNLLILLESEIQSLRPSPNTDADGHISGLEDFDIVSLQEVIKSLKENLDNLILDLEKSKGDREIAHLVVAMDERDKKFANDHIAKIERYIEKIKEMLAKAEAIMADKMKGEIDFISPDGKTIIQ